MVKLTKIKENEKKKFVSFTVKLTKIKENEKKKFVSFTFQDVEFINYGKKIVRTREEVKKKIKELAKDRDNFCVDNYGSEAADNGEYNVGHSEHNSLITLTKFYNWLIGKEK